MKKITLLLVITAMLSLFAFAVNAADVTVTLNGEVVDCASYGQEATIIEGRTMVPLRAIFEALGATVEWDATTRTVRSELGETEISLTVGENKLIKNGQEIALDVPAQIMNDRTLVPVRAVSESFGVGVEWDANTRTVILTQTEETALEKNDKPNTAEENETPKAPANKDAVPAEAKETLTKCLDAAIGFNFNEMAKYTTTPEVVEKLNMSDVDDLFSVLGFDREILTELYMTTIGGGSEDARPFCEAVADITMYAQRSFLDTMTYEVTSYEVVSDDEIVFNVVVYTHDSNTFNYDFEEVMYYGMEYASLEVFKRADEFEGESQKEIYEALAELFKKYTEPLVSEMFDDVKLVPAGDESEVRLVRVNGVWLVELDEDDLESLESMSENGFENFGM